MFSIVFCLVFKWFSLRKIIKHNLFYYFTLIKRSNFFASSNLSLSILPEDNFYCCFSYCILFIFTFFYQVTELLFGHFWMRLHLKRKGSPHRGALSLSKNEYHFSLFFFFFFFFLSYIKSLESISGEKLIALLKPLCVLSFDNKVMCRV